LPSRESVIESYFFFGFKRNSLGTSQLQPSESTRLLEDPFLTLLLDFTFELEDFAELLLDFALELRTTDEELLDFTKLEDEDLAFSLLEEFFRALELEDFTRDSDELIFSDELELTSLTGSSVALTEFTSSPSHAARNSNIKQEIAIHLLPITILKFIRPSKLNLPRKYKLFHPK
jgi:hypothetical protein